MACGCDEPCPQVRHLRANAAPGPQQRQNYGSEFRLTGEKVSDILLEFASLARIADEEDSDLSDMFRDLLREIFDELTELDRRISSCNRKIRNLLRTNEMCQRISRIEGIGPITATALVAAMGDRTCFRNGRQFAAWLGLVPKQKSSGGKARLFALSKRGDRYLRTLMIHGARAVLGKAGGKEDPRSLWITRMRERRHPNVVAVALANKNARIVWSILSRGQEYQPDHAMQAG